MADHRRRAIDNLDLLVESGGVHGFLGPNGSGKTTTIRVLLGLVSADAGGGEIRLLDRPVLRGLPDVIGGVGALVETPLFFPGFTGRLNLRLLAEAAGSTQPRRGMPGTGRPHRPGGRPVQGLLPRHEAAPRHRRGAAEVPAVAVDEPGNGLDPAGIRDVRELIRRLGRDGHTTVLLSSHLLAEIQQVCDHVSILTLGRCVASGPVTEVLASRGSGDVLVQIADPTAAAGVPHQAGFAVSPADGALMVHSVSAPSEITRALAQAALYLEELRRVTPDLESAFLAITEGEPEPFSGPDAAGGRA